jgi:hypothetical protein
MASIAAVDWSSTVRISATTTTCQVVTNPILDRTLLANGKISRRLTEHAVFAIVS